MNFTRKSIRAASVLAIFGATFAASASEFSARAQEAVPTVPAPVAATADTKAAAPAKPQRKPLTTLQEILTQARPSFGLALAINTQGTYADTNDIEKKPVDTVGRVAEAFGFITHRFNSMLAIGAPTYTELATDFSKANPFADMPPEQAFTLLMSGLDDRQRAALASKTGLGFNDMTTTAQKQIFATLLPDGDISVWPRGGGEPKKLGVLRDNPASVHFRVAQEVNLLCEVKNQQYGGSISVPTPNQETGPKAYNLNTWEHYRNLDKVNGVVIRRDVPNRPKPSDLDYQSSRLQVSISITGLKTVGDLIARVAERTKVEIYTEPVYEKKTMTWVTDGRSAAPASELLRAVAFCLTGTYRKVGTAFVLTDDLLGVGTRRQMIQDFEEECDAERAQAVKDAEKAIKENPAQKKLKLDTFGDPLAMTPEQEKTPPPSPYYHQGLNEAALPYEKLTSAQQAAVQSYEANIKAHPENNNAGWSPDFEKNIHVVKNSAVQMVITGLDGVITTEFGAQLSPLFEPEPKKREIPAEELKMFANLPKWKDAAKAVARRAVICKPLTTADVDASLLRIEAMKFNQMWLVVFQDGKARIPGTPFPLDPACDTKVDLLTYAIAEGKKKGITVCPVVDVFAWGKDTPKDLRLWTLRGEDSAQSAARHFKINKLKPVGGEEFDPLPKNAVPSPVVFVDPTDPAAQKALTGLFKAIAGHDGAGAAVCRAMTPEGFANQDAWTQLKIRDGMGFNPALRLAFLQKQHLDPVDMLDSNRNSINLRANLTLANHDGNSYDYELAPKWNTLRSEALQTVWRSLFEAEQSGAGAKKPALLIGQDDGQGFMSWYDDWSDPKAPLPNGGLYAAPPQADPKTGAMPKLNTSVLFLSKETPSQMPKEIAKYDWMDVQMKIMEFYKQFRQWDGIAIEE